jgi:hypothetical protein
MASSHHDRTPSTPGQREDSVLFALGELARLESDRVLAERRAEEQRREEDARRQEREVREREADARRREELEARARAVGEAEARLRVEAELAQDARMSALRAELARVQAEREAMHRSVLEASRPAPETAGGARGWPLAFGLSSVVAAALAGLLVMQAQTAPRVVEIPAPGAVGAPIATPAPRPVEAPPAAVEATPPAAAVEAAPAPVASPTRRVAHPRRGDPTPVREARHDDGLDFGEEGDDVLGGLDHVDTSMAPRTRRAR